MLNSVLPCPGDSQRSLWYEKVRVPSETSTRGSIPLQIGQLVCVHEQAHGAYLGARHTGVGLDPVRLARMGSPAELSQAGHARQEPEVVAALGVQRLAAVHLQRAQLGQPCMHTLCSSADFSEIHSTC